MTFGTLYIVGTPIGNMEDITLRALTVLSSVDTILCEDTRVTAKLLARHEIKTPTLSFHSHSTSNKIDKIGNMLSGGKNIALVTDAGTPGISDPGNELVSAIHEHLPEVSIVAIPGVSALTAALSISGISSSDFLFLGFLPHKKGREKLFSEILESKRTIVFYESPHRIMKTLERLTSLLEVPHRVVVAREITKMYEEVCRGSASEVFGYFVDHKEKQRGEFVVMISK